MPKNFWSDIKLAGSLASSFYGNPIQAKKAISNKSSHCGERRIQLRLVKLTSTIHTVADTTPCIAMKPGKASLVNDPRPEPSKANPEHSQIAVVKFS